MKCYLIKSYESHANILYLHKKIINSSTLSIWKLQIRLQLVGSIIFYTLSYGSKQFQQLYQITRRMNYATQIFNTLFLTGTHLTYTLRIRFIRVDKNNCLFFPAKPIRLTKQAINQRFQSQFATIEGTERSKFQLLSTAVLFLFVSRRVLSRFVDWPWS